MSKGDVLDQLGREAMLGMRAQAGGRGATSVAQYLRDNPGLEIEIETEVPAKLVNVSWCRVGDEYVTGVTYGQAQRLGAIVWAAAGGCVEVVVPEPAERS